MALLRPSLTLVLDLDERVAAEQTILEINRSYAHIGTPVIRTHACESTEDAPVRNTARLIVNILTLPTKAPTSGGKPSWGLGSATCCARSATT